MQEPMIVWAFQITPKNPDLLAYCDIADQAFREATQHRRDLAESHSLDEPWLETPILKLTMKPITRSLLLSLLNDNEPNWSDLILIRETIGVVTSNGSRMLEDVVQ